MSGRRLEWLEEPAAVIFEPEPPVVEAPFVGVAGRAWDAGRTDTRCGHVTDAGQCLNHRYHTGDHHQEPDHA